MTYAEIAALAAECQRIAQALADVPGSNQPSQVETVTAVYGLVGLVSPTPSRKCGAADWPQAHVVYRVKKPRLPGDDRGHDRWPVSACA